MKFIRNRKQYWSRNLSTYYGMPSVPRVMPNRFGRYSPAVEVDQAGLVGGIADVGLQVGEQYLSGDTVDLPGAIGNVYGETAGMAAEKAGEILNKRKANRNKNKSQKRGNRGNGGVTNGNGPMNPGKGGGSDNRRGGPPNYSSPNRSYSNGGTPFGPWPAGNKISLSTVNDPQYYKNPLVLQAYNNNGENTTRVVVNTVYPRTMDFDKNVLTEQAWDRIYADLKMSVNMNTNGGTATTYNNFTQDNLLKYFRAAFEGLMLIAEIDAIQTWNPIFQESNLIMRDIKNASASSIALYNERNRLQDALALMAVPSKMLNYYAWLFQPYKKSPVEGGVLNINRSTDFCEDLFNQDGDFLAMRSKASTISDLINTNLDLYSSITALLMNKVNFSYAIMRTRDGGISTPCYDNDVNAIFCNEPLYGSCDGGTTIDPLYGGLSRTSDTTLKVCFPMDENNVPIYVSAHLLMNYATQPTIVTDESSSGGFPFLSVCSNWDTIYTGLGQYNRYVLEQSSNTIDYPWGVVSVALKASDKDISDHFMSFTGLTDPCDTKLIPKGLNTRTFAPGFDSLTTACVLFFYEMFGVQPIF